MCHVLSLLVVSDFLQESWSGLPCYPPRDLPDWGLKPTSLMSPALTYRFFTTSTNWKIDIFFFFFCQKGYNNDTIENITLACKTSAEEFIDPHDFISEILWILLRFISLTQIISGNRHKRILPTHLWAQKDL